MLGTCITQFKALLLGNSQGIISLPLSQGNSLVLGWLDDTCLLLSDLIVFPSLNSHPFSFSISIPNMFTIPQMTEPYMRNKK